MTILEVVYASAPDNEVIIPTLEIQLPTEWIRVCCGFQDQFLGLETTEMVWFEACSLAISLPAKNATGVQTLTFGVPNIDGRVQRYVDTALEADQEVTLIYREYLSSDKTAPARTPYRMTMRGGVFNGPEVQFQAGFYDLLNTRWPRETYTAESAPGIRYL